MLFAKEKRVWTYHRHHRLNRHKPLTNRQASGRGRVQNGDAYVKMRGKGHDNDGPKVEVNRMEPLWDMNKLSNVCSLLNDNFEFPVYYLSPSPRIELAYGQGQANPMFRGKHEELLGSLTAGGGSAEAPLLRETGTLEHYIEVRLTDKDEYAGSLMAGPILTAPVPEDVINGLMQDYGWPDADSLRQHYRRIAVMSRMKLLHAGALIYYFVYGRKVDTADIVRVNHALQMRAALAGNIDLHVSHRLFNRTFHHDTIFEKRMLQLIKDGRTDELMVEFSSILTEEGLGILAKKSYVRNEKNLSIAAIALATRAAMEGGLQPEVAYTMSDLYIQHIEELTGAREVRNALQEALLDFAAKVKENREDHVSSTIARCKHYIFMHLYEGISLRELSRWADRSPGYVSKLFKQETGLAVSEYIQMKRIEEAKKLLTLTEYSLSDICARLNFNDQSYFTKVFKKVTGVTPLQFRKDPKAAKEAKR
ncbi:helix-turn-helix domain-containing protein [Paenibacillus doosanensis]|nr:helix-turn-helix domain-containing protein [Paenibacillus doosanensis]